MEKQIGLSFKDINLNVKGYEMEEIIRLINTITNSEPKKKETKVKKEPSVEEINIQELPTIRYPKTTNNFRCPSCGQGIMMYAKTNDGKSLLVRDIVKEKPTIHKAIVEKLPELMDDGVINKELLIAVYNDLFKLMHDNVVLVDTDENVTLCPVCKKEHSLKEWIEAYEDPMKYLDHMHICDICGEEGEIIITQTGDTLVCENKCIEKVRA